jgi:RNA polymerase sigma factor (sigma-70 family)
MRKYNVQNYIRYKEDLKEEIARLPDYKDDYSKYSRKQLITKFLPLVESIARKFSTSDQASGILSILDLIQIGSEGQTRAVDKLDWERLNKSEDKEQTMKSFLSKRIKGAIRRRIDMHRGTMRLPEHKLNEMRNTKDKKIVAMFFNSIFLSIDAHPNDDENMAYQIPDKSEPYNIPLMNIYLKSLMKKHLNEQEYEVLRLSYGLDCDKHSAKEIAKELKIVGASDYVRVSELKRKAVETLIDNVDHSQVLDYL